MKKSLGIKLCVIAVLCLMFLAGTMLIYGLVDERQRYHQTVISEIKQAHVGDQDVITPFLVVQTTKGNYPIFAQKSDITTHASVHDDQYQRGIYHAISYTSKIDIHQDFEMGDVTKPPVFPALNPPQQTDKTQPEKTAATNVQKQPPSANQAMPVALKLILIISDLRGVTPQSVEIGGKTYKAKFSDGQLLPFSYLEVDISDQLSHVGTLNAQIGLSAMGIDSLNIVPLGEQLTAKLSSNWGEPKFFGQALPVNKTLTKQGFDAIWQPSFISKDNQRLIDECFTNPNSCSSPIGIHSEHTSQKLGTAFVQIKDTYTLTDRTIKYALILVMICFGTFFLFETLKGLRIHPIQYGLVASSLLVFYVLLLSLAEQMAFVMAYISASIACVGLIGWYACYVLRSKKRGLGFASLLGALYAGFYVVLSANGLNLLLGSVFCFGLLAVVMYVTRHIDWYDVDVSLQTSKTDKAHQDFKG